MVPFPDLPFPDFYQNRTLIFAHRGARKLAPENTLLAFERAYAVGADGVELDVQLSSDGTPIVFHDNNLGRMTSFSGKVGDLTLKDLKTLDVGGHSDDSFKGTSIPTLDEALSEFGEHLLFNIEIKPFHNTKEGLSRTVAACIRKHNLETRVIVSSFDRTILKILRLSAPNVQIGLLVMHPPLLLSHLPQWIHRWGTFSFANAIHPSYRWVDHRLVTKAHQSGLRVNVWTPNAIRDLQQMRELGVDMIITDVPDIARAIMPP